ncbi:MAG: GNAT family N-acetyltransferase [Pseudonocardiaceae bacterium]
MLIRSPQPADEQEWRALWNGYNSFYGASVPEAVTDILWQRIISDADTVFARFAVDADGLSGFAICILHPFTWGVQPVCLLEDLYVDPARRGVGVGRRLLDFLREEAATAGWARLYWHTHKDNTTARRLYDSYASADGFVRYTLVFTGAVATTG